MAELGHTPRKGAALTILGFLGFDDSALKANRRSWREALPQRVKKAPNEPAFDFSAWRILRRTHGYHLII